MKEIRKEIRTLLIAKAPIAGLAKTRLIPALGAEGAASLAARLLSHTLAEVLKAGIGEVELCTTPGPEDELWRRLELPTVSHSDQGGGDLGERLARHAERVLAAGENLMLIGTDCPALDAERMRAAAAAFELHDAVMIPALDGGYVLLGLRYFDATLFVDMPWSTAQVAELTLARLKEAGRRTAVLPALQDIDEPADLEKLPWFLAGEGQ